MKILKGKLKLDAFYFFLPLAVLILIVSFYFRYQPLVVVQLGMIAIMVYLVSVFLYHFFDKSLTAQLSLEYILMAVLVLVLLLGTAVQI